MHLLVAHMASCINLVNIKFGVLYVPSFHDCRMAAIFMLKSTTGVLNCQMLTLLFAHTGFTELPFIIVLCTKRN